MYHDVVPADREDASGFPGGDAARYKLTPVQFDDHLAAIRLKVNRPVDLIENVDLKHGPAPLLLTFDDGGTSATAIAERLELAGWRGHFFMTTAYLGRPGFLDAARVRDLRRRGHLVGSHSYSHPLRMARLPIGRLRDEWTRSVESLADVLGEPIHTASVPGGHHSSAVARAAADAGIRFLFTSEPTVRIRRVAGTIVIGRYVVLRSTPASVVAAVAAGSRVPRVKQLALWELKKAAKMIGGAAYLAVRNRWLGGSRSVEWGDKPRLSKHAP
jgi:peptidoglycan/xylan/chitin deacetylase (PgdA/CDA1 family)